MEFRILGPLEVVDGDRRIPLGGRKRRALLAMLILRRQQVVSVDELIDALWGDDPPKTAEHSVQVYVSELRKALGGMGEDGKVVVARHDPGYALDVPPSAIDLYRFDVLRERGQAALGEQDPARAAGPVPRGARGLARTGVGGLRLRRFRPRRDRAARGAPPHHDRGQARRGSRVGPACRAGRRAARTRGRTSGPRTATGGPDARPVSDRPAGRGDRSVPRRARPPQRGVRPRPEPALGRARERHPRVGPVDRPRPEHRSPIRTAARTTRRRRTNAQDRERSGRRCVDQPCGRVLTRPGGDPGHRSEDRRERACNARRAGGDRAGARRHGRRRGVRTPAGARGRCGPRGGSCGRTRGTAAGRRRLRCSPRRRDPDGRDRVGRDS